MDCFLRAVSVKVFETYGNEISEVCFVFPNRRSAVFFKHYLTQIISEKQGLKPHWLPPVCTVNEIISSYSLLIHADPLTLLFELYQVYCTQTHSAEGFDRFYYWGKILLDDFDDVDKYLVNPDQIFEHVKSWREVEVLFPLLTDELRRSLEYFSYLFKINETDDVSDEKKVFIELWKVISRVYKDYKAFLYDKGIGYEGMVYRDAIENLNLNQSRLDQYKQVVFIGFNALNACEIKFMQWCKSFNKATFFWDYDEYYLDKAQEAGLFLRKNLELFPPSELPISFNALTSIQKKTEIYAVSSDTMQVKVATGFLNDPTFFSSDQPVNTAIVLADEKLLLPVLNSIPSTVSEINVTMGYPFSGSLVHNYLLQLINLQKKCRINEEGKSQFQVKSLIEILQHPFSRKILADSSQYLFSQLLKSNRIFISPEEMNEIFEMEEIHLYLKILLIRTETHHVFPDWLFSLLKWTENSNHEQSPDQIDQSMIFRLKQNLNQLSDVLNRFGIEMGIDMYYQILWQHLTSLSIPFEGEPLEGLQVMGILETRNLDFENLVILSVNEGIFPSASSVPSFIPHNLRRIFGLPVLENRDAIFFYYFYRLLQRAKNIKLLYNSSANDEIKGEPSRYILQLKYESPLKLDEKMVAFDLKGQTTSDLIIEKSGFILKQLENFLITGPDERWFSPTSLTSFLQCRLKFYFGYIVGIKEPDELISGIDAQVFGIIFHKVMEILYKPYLESKSLITKEEINSKLSLAENIKANVKQAFLSEWLGGKEYLFKSVLEGKSFIPYEMIIRYIHEILKLDANQFAPFQILNLENKIKTGLPVNFNGILRSANLYGNIDRIDYLPDLGGVRIVDYKTGTSDLAFKGINELFSRDGKKFNSAMFQVLYYCFLYGQNHSETELFPAIYPVRKMFVEANVYATDQNGNKIKYQHIAESFTQHLINTVEEILDPEVSFDQTTDKKTCEWCIYKQICNR